MDMATFYIKAGTYVRYQIVYDGSPPVGHVIVEFLYERGQATYDGKDWVYKLYV